MIRKATDDDLSAIQTFLRPRAATSLILSSNLRDHGLNGTGHPKAVTLWVATNNNAISAVFGCTEQGLLLCNAPGFAPEWASGLRRALAGRPITGMSGETGQVAALRAGLGLEGVNAPAEATEPFFQLPLADLVLPGGQTRLRPMAESDLALVTDWRIAFDVESFADGSTPRQHQRSQSRAREIVQSGQGRLLCQGSTPVAMTSFNARAHDVVQIGSVYTPPDQRGRGHARRAVALHLAEVREQGAFLAVLFALGAAAVRAYEAIGFVRTGTYCVIDFVHPVTVGDTP